MKPAGKLLPCTVAIVAAVSTFSAVCLAGDEGLLFRFDANMPGSIVDGKTVKDQSPNGHDGLIQGDVHLGDEEGGKAFFFDGTTGYIKIPSLSKWNLKGSVTFSAVVKLLDDGNVEATPNSHDMIVAKDSQFYLGNRSAGNFVKRNFYFDTWDGQKFAGGKWFYNTPKETWLQVDVRLTALGKKGEYKTEYFVNGEKVAEKVVRDVFPQANENPILVGHGFSHESILWLLHGWIASISVFERALTDSEIVRSVNANPFVKTKPEKRLKASVSFVPSKGIGTLEVSGAYFGDMTGAKGSYELKRIGGDGSTEVVVKDALGEFQDDIAQVQFAPSPLRPGQYQFDVTIQLKDQQTATVQVPWEKPDVQLWRDAKAGVSDKVIPPWTPLVQERKGDKLVISCWGRTYTFSGGGLASNIVSRDEQILSEPIELAATVDGKPVQWKYDEPKVTAATPAKISFSGGATGSGLRLEVDSTIEFDGLVVSHFTLKSEPKHQGWFERVLSLVTRKSPSQSGPAVKVGRCALRIPLWTATSKYVSLLNFSKDVESSSFKGGLDQLPDNLYFPYYLWLGDEDRGFAWFSERSLAKRLADPSKAVKLLRGGEKVVQSVNLLDQETILREPLAFTVGFQATPMKPLPKNWRTFFNDRVELLWTSPALNKYYGYPEAANLDSFRGEVKKIHDAGKLCMHLFGIPMLSSASPEFRYFGKDWVSDANMDDTPQDIIAFRPPAAYHSVCPVEKDWIDCLSYKAHKLVQDTGIDGVYIDYTWGFLCRNTNHGCPAEGGYPILALRELYRRAFTMFKSQPKETFVEGHESWGITIAPIASFLDATDMGEEVSVAGGKGSYYNPGAFYSPPITPRQSFDAFKAGYLGQQYGNIPIYWRNPETDPKFKGLEMERRLVAVMLLHDALAYQGWFFTDAAPRMMGIMKAFGVDEATFIPYWGKDQPVTVVSVDPQPPKFGLSAPVVVSVYNRPGKKSLIVVGNTSESALKARVKIDAKALGFSGATTVRDAYVPAGDLSQDGTVTVEIPALESRLLLVE